MKTLLTLLLACAIFSANAQLQFKPSLEAYYGANSKGLNLALLPNHSFFMAELGTEWANFGNDNAVIKGEQAAPSVTSMVYTLTIGASIFDHTTTPQTDVVPFVFMGLGSKLAGQGGGIKVLENISALHLYVGVYGKYTFSDYTTFPDAGISVNYYIR
jgi:hypothetical protein